MNEIGVNSPATQRRRSERISGSVPVSIHGTDLLGQSFSERTTTINFNLHGCRYTSRHQLPKNSWITVEAPSETGGQAVRARVVWIQKPHSIRDYFQVAVEMESPANIWGIEAPPADWHVGSGTKYEPAQTIIEIDVLGESRRESRPLPANLANYIRELVAHMANEFPAEFPSSELVEPSTISPMETGEIHRTVADSAPSEQVSEAPLLRSVSLEIERRAKEAVESAAAEAQTALEESSRTMAEKIGRFHEEQLERTARILEKREAEVSTRESESVASIRAEMDEQLAGVRTLFGELDATVRDLRAEKESAQEASSRMAQARLQWEAAEAARSTQQPSEESREAAAVGEASLEDWRRRLESEMRLAQEQWNELLQSSLDAGVHRLITQVSGRSQEVLGESERRVSERFSELQDSLLQAAAEARQTLAQTKTALEEETARAGFSLAEIEHSAARMQEYSAQLEAASHDSLNGLHRRLEKILEDQTAEMSRRAEGLAAGLLERTGPALDLLSNETLSRTRVDVERILAPHYERAAELTRELQTRELQAEDSLRLHRERLRQISEQSQRESAAQMSSTVASLRSDFEGARKQALTKWSEELDASGVRASHAAAESIERASEWFQQETRGRLQVQVEQTLAATAAAMEEKQSQLASRFETQLEEQSSAKTEQIEQRLDQFAGELTGRSRTQIEQAARTAAESFGQVVQDIFSREMDQFAQRSHAALEERIVELEHSAQRLLRTLETTVATSLEGFHSRLADQLEQGIARGRNDLAEEFAKALEAHRNERAAHQDAWAQSLESISGAAAGRFEERLQTSSDSFVVSSVRRLSEHGQNTVESLLCSAEQSIRDSFSRVFDGLATALRERSTNAAAVSGFAQPPRDTSEPPLPRNDASGLTAGA